MTNRRIDAGPLLALAGALLLLISLFLAWYDDALTAWDAFELVDLLLAAAAIAAIVTALGMVADFPSAPDARVLPWLAGGALVLVLVSLLDPPPAAGDAARDTGVWLALAGSGLMALGALLGIARISIALDVAGRERRQRVEAVDARDAAPPDPPASAVAGGPLFADPPAVDRDAKPEPEPTQPTQPLPATPKEPGAP